MPPAAERKNETSARFLAFFLFLGACFVLFGRSLPFGFAYDDQWTIVRNDALRSAPWSAFFTDKNTAAAPASGMGPFLYRPLPTAGIAAQIRSGMESPWTLRLVNLLLHAMNGFLVLRLLRRMGFSRSGAFLGSSIFLIHPAQVESVAWITQRSNLMATAGALVMLRCLMTHPGPARMAVGWGALAFGLLSKETAAVAPLFLFLHLWADRLTGARRRILWGDRLARWMPWTVCVLITAGYVVLRTTVTGHFGQTAGAVPWAACLPWAGAAFAEALGTLLVPLRMSVSYPPPPAAWSLQAAAGWTALILLALAAVRAGAQGRPARALTWAWVPIAFAPSLGLIPTDTFFAERFLYLPMIGAGMIFAAGWDAIGRPKTPGASWARRLMAAWAALLIVPAWMRIPAWRSDVALWEAETRLRPAHAFAWAALGESQEAAGNAAGARAARVRALELRPPPGLEFRILNNGARFENRAGNPAAGLALAERAIDANPSSPEAHHNRLAALLLLDRKADARRALDAARYRLPETDWSAWAERLGSSDPSYTESP